VTLLLYEEGALEKPRLRFPLDPLRHKSGRVWHYRLRRNGLDGCRYYAYSIDGPEPHGITEYHAFDPEKVLLDPYARSIYLPPDFSRPAAMGRGSNAGRAPLGVITVPDQSHSRKGLARPWHDADAIIYELHVKGFTAHPASGLPPNRRGTYTALVDKIPYLENLGVTVVELMPIYQYDPQEGSFWGYMPLGFFPPHHGYASTEDHVAELRGVVDAFHEAGIEIVLDVVYNHTTEGNHTGPVYSFKGIDNSTYYLATQDPSAPYADFSGTGNALNCSNSCVRKMIIDSMRYWVTEIGVDGFRFDLASIFARNPDGTLNTEEPPIFGDIASEDAFERIRLIAEPWDAGGAYQLGRRFPGLTWQQWNDRFRDDVRRFVRGDPGMVPALMRRIYGSDDLFPDDLAHACRPYQSINYVTCHDGFTLYDLVSYNQKQNWANGHGNRDGADENYSWNCGHEGDESAPHDVVRLRKQQAKNLAALLLLANGTPMLRSGDEFLNSQGGNNNPYNQDNQTGWLDWSRLEDHRDVLRFFQKMVGFRRAHPSLCRRRFWREDVRWYGPHGLPDLSHESRCVAFFLDGESEGDDDLYVMVNGSPEDSPFAVQERSDRPWIRVVDTAGESPQDFCESAERSEMGSAEVIVRGRSVVVLVRSR
jgi:glycogen operon protein